MSDKPRSFERADELSDSGRLPESVAGLTSGRFGALHEKHPGSEMECERALCVGGEVLSEWEAYARAIAVAAIDLEDFRRGWRLASTGAPPPRKRSAFDPIDVQDASEAEMAGWVAYPRKKWSDPWAHLSDADELNQRRNEWDEKRSKLKGDAA